MGFNFTTEIAEIKRLLAEGGKDLEVIAVLMLIYDRGISDERKRIRPIIQRTALNPRDIMRAIDRPLR